MIVHPQLKAAIEDRLKAGWSPEQIAGRMRLERHPIRVSHETIYRFAYSADGRAEAFYRHLPAHRRRRRPCGHRRHHRTQVFDNQRLKDGIGAKSWFCDPQAPWQKGTVENTKTGSKSTCPAPPNRRR